MSATIHRKYKYFHSTVQTAEDRWQKFNFCRLPLDVTSCFVSLIIEEPQMNFSLWL